MERFFETDGSFNEFGRKWVAYILRMDEQAIAPADWERYHKALFPEGRFISFKYGWIWIVRPG